MTTKQIIGTSMILIVICCTILAVGGIWGFIDGNTASQLFGTLVVVAIGLGVSAAMLDRFFKDKAAAIVFALAVTIPSIGLSQPLPVPDDAPNYSGPIIDAIDARLDEFRKRWDDESEEKYGAILEELRAARQEIKEARQERAGLLDAIAEIRQERTTILDSLRELREGREGLLSRISDVAAQMTSLRDDVVSRWTPLQNLVDRLNGLLVKLFVTVLLIGVISLVGLAIFAYLYRRVTSKLDELTSLTIGVK